MTAILTAPTADVRVRVVSANRGTSNGIAATLRSAGIPVATGPDQRTPEMMILAVADTVDAAIDACRPAIPAAVVADRFNPTGVRRAVRLGVRALLRTADLNPDRLVNAVQAARHGDGRLPHEVLIRLLAGNHPEPQPGPTPLTPRQTTVLALMADGYGNADIAKSLACSEHTIKNVIYELMGRLQARNRAHAVACAVRTGLI